MGRRGVISVDGCSTVRRTRAYLDAIATVTPQPVRTLVNTHHHGDHTYANCLFTGATIVAHEKCRDELLEHGLPANVGIFDDVDWGEVELAPPFLTYTDRVTLWSDELRTELRHVGQPAHTTNDSVLWLPERSVLFVGDLLFNGGTPFLLMGSIAGALEVLEDVVTPIGARTIVPGHGPVCGPELIDVVQGYLRFVQSTAEQGRAAGLSPLEAAARGRPRRVRAVARQRAHRRQPAPGLLRARRRATRGGHRHPGRRSATWSPTTAAARSPAWPDPVPRLNRPPRHTSPRRTTACAGPPTSRPPTRGSTSGCSTGSPCTGCATSPRWWTCSATTARCWRPPPSALSPTRSRSCPRPRSCSAPRSRGRPPMRDFMAFEEHVKTSSQALGHEVNPVWYEIPIFYFTNPANVRGPFDDVPIAPGSTSFDYEMEIAAVVGRGGSDLDPATAEQHIAGYVVFNDWSARDLQAREMLGNLGAGQGQGHRDEHERLPRHRRRARALPRRQRVSTCG